MKPLKLFFFFLQNFAFKFALDRVAKEERDGKIRLSALFALVRGVHLANSVGKKVSLAKSA